MHTTTQNDTRSFIEQEMESFGKEIQDLMKDYPCLREVCKGVKVGAYPAALFTSACFLGTLLTRCTYRFYHRPEELRRLNYGIYIIGDPGSGKSFATRLYKLLADPIIQVSDKGRNAVNRYKRKYKEWMDNGQKGDGPSKPKALIRTHPARTSNKVFIEDMNNAVDIVDGKEMHLHLLSFDTELSNSIKYQGESWNSKQYMELKAFHNETDGECYVNSEKISDFDVFWNYVYTGTPMALETKVNQRNFGNGLSTRLAVIPMPSTHFEMMKYETLEDTKEEPEEDKTLRMWAERLDKEYGELPIEKLVDEVYEWTTETMADAKDNDSLPDESMCKRVAYYGINVSVPFIMMRHWDEWTQHHTLTIDETDLYFCQLICEIQFTCQRYFFTNYWISYFREQDMSANSKRDTKHYSQKMKQRYRALPNKFNKYDLMDQCGVKPRNAEKIIERWMKEGYIVMGEFGTYEKVILDLM